MFDKTKISACACLGPMYGEPHCPCSMKRMGLEHVMESNPIRKEAQKRDAENWKKANEPGGFFYEMYRQNREADDEHRN